MENPRFSRVWKLEGHTSALFQGTEATATHYFCVRLMFMSMPLSRKMLSSRALV
jgi:hypothetical protein